MAKYTFRDPIDAMGVGEGKLVNNERKPEGNHGNIGQQLGDNAHLGPSFNPKFQTYATVKLGSSSPKVRGENETIFELPPPRNSHTSNKMLVNVASSRPNFLAKFIICNHQPQLVSAQLQPYARTISWGKMAMLCSMASSSLHF